MDDFEFLLKDRIGVIRSVNDKYDLDDETRERLIAVFIVGYGLCVFNAFMKGYKAYKNKALK